MGPSGAAYSDREIPGLTRGRRGPRRQHRGSRGWRSQPQEQGADNDEFVLGEGTLYCRPRLLLAGCGGAPANSDTQGQNTSQASKSTNAGCGTVAGTAGTEEKPSELPTVTIAASCGEKVRVLVEIADNPVERYIGLRRRESMPEDQGMLLSTRGRRTYQCEHLIHSLLPDIDSKRRL